ncbi:DNA mismatch repair protein, partial [Globisporangium splendens]
MSDLDDAAQPEIAIQIKNTKLLKQVGVAVRRPRLRRSCVKGQADEDTKHWEFVLYAFSDSSELTNLETLLVQIAPSRCYLPAGLSQEPHVGDSKKLHSLLKALDVANAYTKKNSFKETNLESNLGRLLGAASMAAYKNELDMELATGSLACLIDALELMSDAESFGCYTLCEGNLSSAMQLDSSAIWSLNLLPDPANKSTTRYGGSVLEILNRGKTPMGRRLLERWIRQPLVNLKDIQERQNIVQIFVDDTSLRMELLDECMKALPDLERLGITLEKKKNVKIDDLVNVYDAAKGAIPRILSLLSNYEGECASIMQEKYTTPLTKILDDLSGYMELIEEVVDLDTRPNLVVNAKHDEDLLALRNEWNDVLADIEDEHRNARETIGGDIKCEKDKVREFVFRIVNTKEEARISKLPYVHICQVLVSGVQFTTFKLKALASEHRRIKQEYEKRQANLLNAAIDVATTYVPVLEAATSALAELDVLLGFAHAACHAGSGYCRPTLEDNGECVVLTSSRHPCVELQDQVDFIPNDYHLVRDESRFQLITGPNMGGKSTYIRQLGTIVVMAQIGSFVPADVARLPVFDKLLVRVGAGDLQQRGVSTFMMEMLEASAILHKATDRSLVIIDELGRGTSTYDGFGLAWAISEYLLDKVRAMCLFATHFHELTSLAQEHPRGFANKHVTAVAGDKQITMVYQVRDGACMESFGVHVAAMAGFPASVIDCARHKSHELESFGVASKKRPAESDGLLASGSAPLKQARVAFAHAFAALPLAALPADEAVASVRSLLVANRLEAASPPV